MTSISRRGRFLLGSAFATFAISAGIMHSYAVFLVAFLEDFRWSRAETSLAFSVSQLVAGVSSPLVGRFGVTWGARGPAITAKTADLFPGRHLGAILGVITIGTGFGSAVGSWAAGWIFDLSGSYRLPFVLSIASYLGGAVAFWALGRPARRYPV